jgi:hypothetical protein
MSDRDLIGALAARIVELEARIGGVDERVAELRARRRGTMLEDRRCPVCGGGELVHVKQATQATDYQVAPLGLDHTHTWRGLKTRGTFEYYVCRGCRLVETYATALDELLDAIDRDSDNITTLSTPAETSTGGPYR